MAEIDPVLKTIIAEALGEGAMGQQMVAETILNRATQRGLTPTEVVQQPDQYTGYWNPGADAVRAFSDPNAVSAAQAAWELAQGPDDPTGGANHYFNPNIVQPSWARSMTPTVTHGGHAFYTDRPVTKTAQIQSPTPATQSNTIQRQRDLIPSNASPALKAALARLATASTIPSPATQSGDLSLMRNPNMSQEARNKQVTPYPANQSLDMLIRRSPGETVATIPTSGIGLPPTTKRVQSIPFGNSNANQTLSASALGQVPFASTPNANDINQAARRAALQMNQSYVGMDSQGGMIPNQMQKLQQVYQYGGPTRPNMNQLDRLPQGGALTVRNPTAPMTSNPIQVAAPPPFPLMASEALQASRRGGLQATRQGGMPLGAAPQVTQPAQGGGGGLRIVVDGANTIQPQQQAQTVVQALQSSGLSPSQAYAVANAGNNRPTNAYERMIAGIGGGGGGVSSLYGS